jgi:hypothetical protein
MLLVGERNSMPLVGWEMAGLIVVVDSEPLLAGTVVDPDV